jgi:hypothetical protein
MWGCADILFFMRYAFFEWSPRDGYAIRIPLFAVSKGKTAI